MIFERLGGETFGKVMIIEDEPIIAGGLEDNLTRSGYEVVGICETYEEVENLLATTRPDIALVDIKLTSERDGINIVAELLAPINIASIFITSYTDLETISRAIAVPSDVFIRKPYLFAELKTNIDFTIRRHREFNRVIQNREIMLREAYHRVKNNLNVLEGLLLLRKLNTNTKNEVDLIEEIRQNLVLIKSLNARLLSSESARLNSKVFLDSLLDNIIALFNLSVKSITINRHFDAVEMESNKLLGIGLMLNETLTNAIKYAFDDNRKENNNISVEFYKKSNHYLLMISDNGKGFNRELFDRKSGSSMGFEIIKSFANQSGIDFELLTDEANGTTFIFRISF